MNIDRGGPGVMQGVMQESAAGVLTGTQWELRMVQQFWHNVISHAGVLSLREAAVTATP